MLSTLWAAVHALLDFSAESYFQLQVPLDCGVSPLFLLQVFALTISETRGGKPAQLVKRAFIESTGPCWSSEPC
ncbi:hypothetical protein DKX38_003533 [Salix brachista]|uniref:Uncharacterized protein n=1 Tax=Salix brachista TaxID=2182728 RepID=A0A5N5NQ47_9ROSI|nr:hypothetical protein DKX38_003533 [Salix brachista]